MDADRGELAGWIADYWEQGMEEEPWLTFQDEAFTAGATWDRAGLHRLAPGGVLTIFEDGAVRWSGVLGLRRTGLFGLFGAFTITPPDVDERTWRSWFRRSPPLRARYRPPAPG